MLNTLLLAATQTSEVLAKPVAARWMDPDNPTHPSTALWIIWTIFLVVFGGGFLFVYLRFLGFLPTQAERDDQEEEERDELSRRRGRLLDESFEARDQHEKAWEEYKRLQALR